MAAALLKLFFFLHTFAASALESASERVLPEVQPHLTSCASANMETFRCRWNTGTSQSLSQPGDLRLFYIIKLPPDSSPKEWRQCPHYSTDRPNECFFNENHTSIWTSYSIQLRSRDQAHLYDEKHFHVQDIVQPDPPVGLNWTVLNVSLTGTHYDIMLSWKPPQSADVEMGWMTLQYEVQYRDVNSNQWEVVDLVKSTKCSVYGLQTNVNHEIRVRCKMLAGKEFGEFSDSLFVLVPSKMSSLPVVALLVLGALCLVTIMMLVIISQQEKLMVFLLPPVPGPKIRGIDPELLKKGKLRELTSILGGPPHLRPELYYNDPWVEFIDLDMEEQNERLTDLDTDRLVECSLSSSNSPPSIGFRDDDDSGRASCCDPDLPSEPEASPFVRLIPNQTRGEDPSRPPAREPRPPAQSPAAGEPRSVAPGREALYTKVSEVRPSGKVLLSPEEQTGRDAEKDAAAQKETDKNQFRLLVVNPDRGGYASELDAGKMSPGLSMGDTSEPCQTDGDLSYSPSRESDGNPMSPLSPAPVYTVVEGVDRQNSLLLTPNSTPAPQLVIPKVLPTPGGYLTPELMGSITP